MSKKHRNICKTCNNEFRSKQKSKALCPKCASPKWLVVEEDKLFKEINK